MSSRIIGFDLREQSDMLTDTISRLGQVKDGLERAVSMGINKTLESGRVRAVALLREVYAVKIKDAKQTMAIDKAAPGKWGGALNMRGDASLPLARFAPRPSARLTPQPKRGVSVLVTKATGRKAVPFAFVVNKPGGPVLFAREKGAARLPIRKLYGPSFLTFFDKMENWDPLTDYMEERMDLEISRAGNYLLKKAGIA